MSTYEVEKLPLWLQTHTVAVKATEKATAQYNFHSQTLTTDIFCDDSFPSEYAKERGKKTEKEKNSAF